MKATLLAISCVASLCAQQQPQVENSKLETRAFAGSLASQLRSFGAGTYWAAWAEPIIPGRHGDMCGWDGNGWNGNDEHAAGAPVRLEGPTSLVVLVRMENAQVDRIRVASLDCRFDGGGLPFYWLSAVPAGESVSWLKAQTAGNHADAAIMAISLHSGPAADRALDDFAAANQPERVREKAAFWLGSSRGARGVDILKRMLASDPSQRVREQVVFALSQSPDPAGIAAVIAAVRNNPDPAVRKRAMFWLGQSKDPRALDFFAQVLKP